MTAKEKGDEGEQKVYKHFVKPFFEEFCFPNPIDEDGDKKEICDLLILFGKYVIIISVKNYSFSGKYNRFFRKTVDKAVKQLHGAERKLFNSNNLYISHPTRGRVQFDKEQTSNVLSIIVNLGDDVRFYPFNNETTGGRFVHIFDEFAIENLLIELDTPFDFIKYLNEREATFKSKKVTILPKEEYDFEESDSIEFSKMHILENIEQFRERMLLSGNELDYLALYLRNNRSFPELFTSKEYDGFTGFFDNSWENYINEEKVILKKALDRKSYFIDEFVRREVLNNLTDNKSKYALAEYLLSLNRFERRYFAKNFYSFIEKYSKEKTPTGEILTARRQFYITDNGYLLFLHSNNLTHDDIILTFETAFLSYQIYTEYKFKIYIAIGIDQDLNEFKTYYSDEVIPFTEGEEKQIMHTAKMFGWYSNFEMLRSREQEYPDL